MNTLNKVTVFFQKLWIELTQKVTWPSRRQILESTIVLVAFILIWATFIGAVDFVFASGLSKFLEFVKTG
jgi:preprotein translocase SecE subunit